MKGNRSMIEGRSILLCLAGARQLRSCDRCYAVFCIRRSRGAGIPRRLGHGFAMILETRQSVEWYAWRETFDI